MNKTNIFFTASLLLGLSACARAQSSYDTENSYLGATVGTLGVNIPTFGQTFNAPTGGYNTMLDFSFWIAGTNSDGFAAESDTFVAQVYQWNGSAPVGSALFSQNLGSQTFGPDFDKLTIDTNLAMTAGDQYVALITDTSGRSTFNMEIVQSHPAGDGGGNFIYNNSLWENDSADDLAWHADFSGPSGSPEPVTLSLGLAGIGIALRRRMRARS
jgi:hypothetical protein